MSTQFWDRLWRSAGIQFVVFFTIAYFVYGDQPMVGSSPDALMSFYDGNRMRILIAAKIAGSGNQTFTSGLNDLVWICFVMTSFPRVMLIMAGTFGLWRAGIISNALFGAGVAALVLVLLGGTTWATNGIWAPDGAYSRFISPVICIAWVLVISGVLLKSPSAARTPDRAAVPQW